VSEGKSMKPKRIQLSRKKGWRMPENTVKVDRTSGWGNPFKVGRDGDAAECVAKFKEYVSLPVLQDKILRSLGGKNLACWCKRGAPCHADVLLEIANP
jgi:Domain of unknown function (DUF4326)